MKVQFDTEHTHKHTKRSILGYISARPIKFIEYELKKRDERYHNDIKS